MIPALIGYAICLPYALIRGTRNGKSVPYILTMWFLLGIVIAVITKFLFGA